MPDFSRRATTPELMDTEDCDFETFRGCLVDLARVNRLTLAYRPTLGFLDALARTGRLPKDRPLQILDVGSGYGDMLREIFAWSRRRGISVAMEGVDLNPWAAQAARAATPDDVPVIWRTGDAFAERTGMPPDLVISSLFTHHLDDASVVRFLSWMDTTARIGWFVNDLHRHPLPYHVFARASRALRLHRYVQHDGPVSIERSFSRADWSRFLENAGVPMTSTSVTWWTPFRLCVSRYQRS